MPELLLPASVARELQKQEWAEQRAEYRAMLDKLFDFRDPECGKWNVHLKALDPRLRLGRARPRAAVPGFTVIPGYYHWVRDNESTAPTITPITGPNDSFAYPDDRVLEDLAKCDLQNPKVFARLLAQREEAERTLEREREALQQEVKEDAMGRWLAARRTQVSMNDSEPWAQNHAGRKKRGK